MKRLPEAGLSTCLFAIQSYFQLFNRYRLGKVAGLIYIVASLDAGVVSQKLHGDNGKDRRNERIHSRDSDSFRRVLADFCIIFITDAKNFSSAGADFFDVAVHLRADIILCSYSNDRCIFGNQGKSAVL